MVPGGPTTDFASVPRFIWGLISSYGTADPCPAILHDYYAKEAQTFVTRRAARRFISGGRSIGGSVSHPRAAVMLGGCRAGELGGALGKPAWLCCLSRHGRVGVPLIGDRRGGARHRVAVSASCWCSYSARCTRSSRRLAAGRRRSPWPRHLPRSDTALLSAEVLWGRASTDRASTVPLIAFVAVLRAEFRGIRTVPCRSSRLSRRVAALEPGLGAVPVLLGLHDRDRGSP